MTTIKVYITLQKNIREKFIENRVVTVARLSDGPPFALSSPPVTVLLYLLERRGRFLFFEIFSKVYLALYMYIFYQRYVEDRVFCRFGYLGD